MKMTYTSIFSIALIASFTFSSISCNKNDSNSGGKARDSILKESVKPGYLPDGTKVDPLTKEELQQVANSLQGVAAVNIAISKASELTNNLPGGNAKRISSESKSDLISAAQETVLQKITETLQNKKVEALFNSNNSTDNSKDSNYSDELISEIKEKCEIKKFDPKTTNNITKIGNSFSGTGALTAGSEISNKAGMACPLSSQSSYSGSGNISGTIGANDQLESLSANGSLQFGSKLNIVSESVKQKSGLIAQDFKGTLGGNISLNSQVFSVDGSADFILNFETLEETSDSSSQAQILADILVSGNGKTADGSYGQSQGSINIAVIIKSAKKIVLIQIFANNAPGTQQSEIKIYINGVAYEQGQFKNMFNFSKK